MIDMFILTFASYVVIAVRSPGPFVFFTEIAKVQGHGHVYCVMNSPIFTYFGNREKSWLTLRMGFCRMLSLAEKNIAKCQVVNGEMCYIVTATM